ncbi:hypothetical protein DFQ01_11249 [Paenibacillus cellulosilyticus]|uniref:Uncharacterized protein n=1 Tax=Paenibacillus cellulosilyticus TaxID=375489 RepID=A0A2V2YS57_9BACL|nr:hypothetical protein [Paenibacillus cellulosilyticus]PWW00696.1 hypothetical protein DFQ01_11249 [Paenibacillus cellulosilyticus]
MRSEDQIKRMIVQLQQLQRNLHSEENAIELEAVNGKIEILEWVLNAPVEKYHV